MVKPVTVRNAHFPGKAEIDAYGNGGFRFADMSHKGSILCLPSGIYGWDFVAGEAMTADRFQRVLDEADRIETLLIGTGLDIRMIPKDLKQVLKNHNIASDPMSTGAAIRTYNIMLAESRAVACALVAV